MRFYTDVHAISCGSSDGIDLQHLGQEPYLSHYYEIIRADTTSEATRDYYRKLCIEYHSHFDPDYVE
jgi:hypothetical protein